jgi:hypothetical protein
VDPGSIAPIDTSAALPDGITVTTSRPTFSFKYPNDVASYTLQICAARDFSVPAIVEETAITEQTHRISTPLSDNTTYFWRMKPAMSDGSDGGWTSTHAFFVDIELPSYLDPEVEIFYDSPFPRFSWQNPAGIDNFEIGISTSADFSAGTQTRIVTGSAYKWDTPLTEGQTYYWRMRSLDFGSPSGWSGAIPLHIRLFPPVLNYPCDKEVSDPSPTFGWRLPSVAQSDAVDFQIQIDASSSSFSSAVSYQAGRSYLSNTDSYEYDLQASLECEHEYFWRVRAKYAEGYFGPWSDSTTFRKNRVSKVLDANLRGAKLLTSKAGELYSYSDGWLQSWSSDEILLWSKGKQGYTNSCLLTPTNEILCVIRSYPEISLTASDGDEVWQYGSDSWSNLGMPALWSDGSACFAQGETSSSSVVAVDRYGKFKWSFPLSINHSSPAIGSDGTVYVFSEGLFAIRPDGTTRWKTSIRGSNFGNINIAIGASGVILLSLTVDYAEARLIALNPSDGSIKWTWTYNNGAIYEPIVGPDGTIFISLWSYYAAIDPDDGSTKWSVDLDTRDSGILGNDGVIYTIGTNISWQSIILAINSADGSVAWRVIRDDYGIEMPTMAADGTLVSASDSQPKPGFYVIPTTATGLADSPWPTSRHDPQRTGRASAP